MSAPDDSAAVVQLEDVAMRFNDDDPVLDGVDLEVAQKERVVILGQSGSGKSTILRLILGILTPTRGSILVKGRDIARMSRRQLNRARHKIGMIYQYSALISSLRVRDNLALPLEELTDKSRAKPTRFFMPPLSS